MVTILILACDEAELAIRAVESVRNSVGETEIEVVLVDNGSSDGLSEWASTQGDITYVYMDNGVEPWSKVLNEVINELPITGDFVVMHANQCMAKGCMESLVRNLYSDEMIAMISCPVCEIGTEFDPKGADHIENVMKVNAGFYMMKKEIYDKIGGYEEKIYSLFEQSFDIALRLIDQGYRLVVDHGTCVYADSVRSLPEPKATISWANRDTLEIERKWGIHYFNTHPNMDLIEMLDSDNDEEIRVLDIGCDCGANLFGVKSKYPNAITYGCDISEGAVKTAAHFSDRAFVNNIEEESLDIEDGSLDYIMFGDVLEHLHDPAKTLNYIQRFLKPNGRVVASIPNLMHISVMKQILNGDFTYTETGLLDKTHIHMFTYNEIIRMFKSCGYDIECAGQTVVPITQEDEALIGKLTELGEGTERFMYETFQYQIRAKKSRM